VTPIHSRQPLDRSGKAASFALKTANVNGDVQAELGSIEQNVSLSKLCHGDLSVPVGMLASL
jgi:hypothetical protein